MKLKFNIGYPTVVIVPLLLVFTFLLVFEAVHSTPVSEKTASRPPTSGQSQLAAASSTSSKPRAASTKGTIYLTFDDGPDRYTDELLSVLEKNRVKATFFVTNCHPEYQNYIAKESAAGHAVGVHSYSHDYAKIYSGDEAFWEDFDAMDDIILKQTGQRAKLLRFPGGSSNVVSKKYSRGLMKKLIREADARGLTYVDWNIQCGDSDGQKTTNGVYRHLVCEVSRNKTRDNIILCHDIKPYTVRAVDRFIQWAKAEGYEFAVLTPDGFTVHLKLNN